MSQNKISDSDIEKYLKHIENELLNFGSPERTSKIVSSVRSDIHAYVQDHPECQMKDIEEYINVSDIYSGLIAESNTDQLIEKIDHQSILKKGGRLVALIAVLITLACTIHIGIEKYIDDSAVNTMRKVDINAPEVNR